MVEDKRGSCYTHRKAEKNRLGSSKRRWEANIEMDDTAATADGN